MKTLALVSLLSAAMVTGAQSANYESIDNLAYSTDTDQAVATLREKLKSSDAQTRWRAARALGILGESATAAAPDLAAAIADDEPVVVAHAAIALAHIGDKSEKTLAALIGRVSCSDERVARAALQALSTLGAPPEKLASALEQVLETDDAAVMCFAVDSVVERGADATPFLNAALAKEKASYWAALAIGEIGPAAAGTVPALVELLGRAGDPQTKQLALVALAKIGPDAHEASAAIQELARSTEDDAQRIAACYAMGAIGADSSTALLRELETSGGEFQTMAAAWALAKIHPDDPAAMDHAIELVVAGLKNDREEVRNAAAAGLKELEPPVGKAGPALVEAVRSATPEQRAHIALALASLGPEIVDSATRALADEDLRDVAIEVLGRLGPEAAASVEELKRVLASASAETIAHAQYALASIGADAGPAAEDLGRSLENTSVEVRQSALFALRQLGAAAQPAEEAMHEFLESADSDFERFATAWALARIKLSAHLLEEVTETLTEALGSDDEQVRLETISAIGDLGPGAAPFQAKLKELAENDPSAEVRAAANQAVE